MSSSKIKYLFGDQLERWHYHSDYLQYVTPDQIGQKLVSLADNEYDLSRLHLWDMFSGIGTDTIKFSNMCRKVTATEIDSKTHSNLKLNIKEFGVSNVDTHLADCTLFSPAGVDLIYFDPLGEIRLSLDGSLTLKKFVCLMERVSLSYCMRSTRIIRILLLNRHMIA